MPARHVYVHVPFCARRCSYCDFAIAVRRRAPVHEFLEGLRREVATRFPEDTVEPVDTVYLGGGTPSRLGDDGVALLLDVIRSRWSPVPEAEITLEANPEDVDDRSARAWAAAGVTRVSLGAQSFQDAPLQWMHRTHDARRVEAAVGALLGAGIENWSLDLIFALPAEVRRDWRADLERAVRLRPMHLSAYGLTLEPHTPFAHWTARGEVREARESVFESEFLEAHHVLAGAGYAHYEVSNYAIPGGESEHNSAYWRRSSYVGLGPSAHSFGCGVRRWNEREYVAWLRRASRGEDPVGGAEDLSPDAIALEEVYLGLRTTAGVQVGATDRPVIEPWVRSGWAMEEQGVLTLTPLGWLRLDALAGALTEFRSRL